jgi:dTDP-4-amino-4,6-dideoxygalactose transaminase
MCGRELVFVQQAFESNYIAPVGPHVDAFEQEVGARVGTRGAVALSSGTAAIHMALKACGVSPGDYVFCSAFTFAASCNPVLYEGGTPVFIDSEPETFNMSPVALKKAFDVFRPKAVIVVNAYGQCADYERILPLCEERGVPVIEDAAESLGAAWKERPSGSIGTFGVFSFNGNKIITTSGGGMLVSNNLSALERVRYWSTQSRDKVRHYQHREVGFNYKMSNIAAGIGRGQLTVLKERISRKKAIYDFYKEAFLGQEGIRMGRVYPNGSPNYWLSVATLGKECPLSPMDVILALDAHNVECRMFWKPMQMQPLFSRYPFFSHGEGRDVSAELFDRGICLPSDTKMTDMDLQRIARVVADLLKRGRALHVQKVL